MLAGAPRQKERARANNAAASPSVVASKQKCGSQAEATMNVPSSVSPSTPSTRSSATVVAPSAGPPKPCLHCIARSTRRIGEAIRPLPLLDRQTSVGSAIDHPVGRVAWSRPGCSRTDSRPWPGSRPGHSGPPSAGLPPATRPAPISARPVRHRVATQRIAA